MNLARTVILPWNSTNGTTEKILPLPLVTVKDEAFFFDLVKNSFVQRRKTLWNNLVKAYVPGKLTKEQIQEALDSVSIEPNRRAETLTIEEFAALSNQLQQFVEE